MLHFPKDIKNARILLANDDSIHSHGFQVLEETIKSICDDVWVVAPETEQSAQGHSLTIHTPLRIKQYGEKRYSVFGTPTDCVMMGVKHILRDHMPDIVISGINHGHNVADDITYSGTVAVAAEGTIIGIPSVAFSCASGKMSGHYNWDIPKQYIPKILEKLKGQSWDENTLINVNFPYGDDNGEPDIVVVKQGHYAQSLNDIIKCEDPRGRDYYWIGPPDSNLDQLPLDTDVRQVHAGKITVTALSLNLTHEPTMSMLEGLF